ncbi:hypothetical protein AXG93_4620s1050 [Marchantia polymorpha subsp. ruderalis]|uniref:Uncharacterized protein n=1 Tax=Marchantia polymorpha subsp. ruderalis TaxID=1480154 RepID=A0A176VYF0_MARPO|nr:hypothetical protein AXG93_4620s1050 [Marchantia polymorpha subsp. ruderalis]
MSGQLIIRTAVCRLVEGTAVKDSGVQFSELSSLSVCVLHFVTAQESGDRRLSELPVKFISRDQPLGSSSVVLAYVAGYSGALNWLDDLLEGNMSADDTPVYKEVMSFAAELSSPLDVPLWSSCQTLQLEPDRLVKKAWSEDSLSVEAERASVYQLVELNAYKRERAMGFMIGVTAASSVSEVWRCQVLGQAMNLNCLTWIVSLGLAEQHRVRIDVMVNTPLVSSLPTETVVAMGGSDKRDICHPWS